MAPDESEIGHDPEAQFEKFLAELIRNKELRRLIEENKIEEALRIVRIYATDNRIKALESLDQPTFNKLQAVARSFGIKDSDVN
jgi:hypothetical protein